MLFKRTNNNDEIRIYINKKTNLLIIATSESFKTTWITSALPLYSLALTLSRADIVFAEQLHSSEKSALFRVERKLATHTPATQWLYSRPYSSPPSSGRMWRRAAPRYLKARAPRSSVSPRKRGARKGKEFLKKVWIEWSSECDALCAQATHMQGNLLLIDLRH